MSTALSARDRREVDAPPQDVAHAIHSALAGLKAIRTFVESEFVEGVDYGKIPGCGDKPALLNPGAQKAIMYFNAYPTYKVHERDLSGGHVDFRVRAVLISRATLHQVGEGIGCCSSMEKKYRWRPAERACPSCGRATIRQAKDRPEFYCWAKIGGCGAKFRLDHPGITSQGDAAPVENPDVYDVRNTVLKMGKKRALVDAAMTLGCLAELFTQDIEDTYESGTVREAARPFGGEVAGPGPAAPPAPRPQNAGLFTRESVARTAEFLAYLREECGPIQARWADRWDARCHRAQDLGKDVPARIPELINAHKAKEHLLKWAKRTGRLHADVDPANARSREAEAYLAAIFHGGEAGQTALIDELGGYISLEARRLTKEVYGKYPELAPAGHREEGAEAGAVADPPDRGDAHDGEGEGDDLDDLDRDLGEGGT